MEGVIEGLLPNRWREAAREMGAFRRARYVTDPAQLLRLLLFHAVNDGGLRQTVAQARGSGIAAMSQGVVQAAEDFGSVAGVAGSRAGAGLARTTAAAARTAAAGNRQHDRCKDRPAKAPNGASIIRWI